MAIKPIEVALSVSVAAKGDLITDIEKIKPVITIEKIDASKAIGSLEKSISSIDFSRALKGVDFSKSLNAGAFVKNIESEFKKIDFKWLKDSLVKSMAEANSESKKLLKSMSEEENTHVSSARKALNELSAQFAKKGKKIQSPEQLKEFENVLSNLNTEFAKLSKEGANADIGIAKSITHQAVEAQKSLERLTTAEDQAGTKAKKMAANQVAAYSSVKSAMESLESANKAYRKVSDDQSVIEAQTKRVEDLKRRATELKNLGGDMRVDDANKLHSDITREELALRKLIEARKEATSANQSYAKSNNSASLSEEKIAKRAETLSNRLAGFLDRNPKVARSGMGTTIKRWMQDLSGIDLKDLDAAKTKIDQIDSGFRKLQTNASIHGLSGKGFFDKINSTFLTFTGWSAVTLAVTSAGRAVRDVIKNVKDLDHAMTELKKVTDLSDNAYNEFYDNAGDRAKKLGATMVDTIQATADASRLGLNLREATAMADASLVYKNVGDGIEDISDASNSIISTVQAFQNLGYSAENSMAIVDKFNEVGNHFAITSSGIGEALQRSAAAMSAGNNTLDETIGLITAANTVVQNPDSVGTMLKTVSMYLRASKAEAEAAGESTDGMANSLSSLRDTIKTLTHGAVDIQIDENTYKSTYQILKEIAGVWDSLTDIDQAAITEKLGGKRNANAVSAILQNFDIAEDATRTAADSTNSALIENEKYLDSVEGKLSKFSATWEAFSSALVDSSIVKGVIDFGTTILNLFTSITQTLGGIPTIITSIISAITIRSSVLGKNTGLFNLFGVDEKSGKNGLYGSSPFMPIIKNLTKNRREFKTSKDAIIAGGKEVKDFYKGFFKDIWNGTESKFTTMNELDRFNEFQKKIDALTDKNKTYRKDGKLIPNTEKPEELKKVNEEFDKYIERQKRSSKIRGEYFDEMRKNKKLASEDDLQEYASTNGYGYGEGGKERGLKQTLKNTVGSIGNMMAGMVASAAITLAFDAAISGAQKLYKAIAVTKDEMAEATKNAESYTNTAKSLDQYQKQINDSWSVINSAGATGSDKIQAYEQLKEIQAELIDQYGQHSTALIDISTSAETAANSINNLAQAEANNYASVNFEEINKAKTEFDKVRSYTSNIGAFNPDAKGYDQVFDSLKSIIDTYEEATLVADENGGYNIIVNADATNAQRVFNELTEDIETMKSEYAGKGIDVSDVFVGLTNVNTVFAGAKKQLEDIRSQYGDVYDAAIKSSITQVKEYSDAVVTLTGKQDELSQAMSKVYNTPEDRVSALKHALDGLSDMTAESLLGDKYGVNSSVDNYFNNWIQSLQGSIKEAQLEVDIDDWINISKNPSEELKGVQDALNGTLKDIDLGGLKLLEAEYRADALTGPVKDAFKVLDSAASSYGVSISDLLDKMYQFNAIQGDAADLQYNVAEALSKVENSFSSGNIAGGFISAMQSQGQNGGVLSSDAYTSLIESSSEYAKAIEYENGYVRLNTKMAKELSDAKANVALKSIEEQKSIDLDRYKRNTAEIQRLLDAEKDLDDTSKTRLNDLQSENSLIEANIQKYNAYASTLKQISSGYYAFTQVSEADNSDVEFGKAGEARKVIKEALKSGKTGVGNVQYQMALDFIIPDDVQQKGEKAVKNYMATIDRYMSDERKGKANFITDMITAGVATKEDGMIKLRADMTMDKFLDAFANAGGKVKPITEDVVDTMFGIINMYSDDEFKIVDPKDISNIMTAVSDFQKAQAEYKSAIGDENIAKKKEELSTYAEALKDIPEEQLTELGIKFVDGEGRAVSPDEIANAVNSGTTINVDENANRLINDLRTLNDLKTDIKVETDFEKVSKLKTQIENITDRINKTASEKFGFDAEITSIKGLADAYATVSENLEMYKSRKKLFEQNKLNTSEIDAKIAELESQKVEINGYMEMQGMDEVHAKISELKKNIEETKAALEHDGKVGTVDTSEAEKKLAEYERELNAIGNTEVGAKVSSGDLDALYTQAEGVWQKIQEITKGDHTVKLSASEQGNVDELYSQLEELQQLIQESGGELNIDFSFKGEKENELVSVITEIAGEEYNLNIKINQQAIRDQIFSALDGFEDLLDLPEQEVPVTPVVSSEDYMNYDGIPDIPEKFDATKLKDRLVSAVQEAMGEVPEQEVEFKPVPSEDYMKYDGIPDIPEKPIKAPVEYEPVKSPDTLGRDFKPLKLPVQPEIDKIKIAGDLSIGDIKEKINATFAGFHPEVSIRAKVASEGAQSSGGSKASGLSGITNSIKQIASTKMNALSLKINSNADAVKASLNAIENKKLTNKSVTITEYHQIITTGGSGGGFQKKPGHAYGTKSAPGGSSLVGELGPELVVSNGTYYIAGQFGAEFVDLNKGDIVFNHKDTERILKGEPGARGRALSSGSISVEKAFGSSGGSGSNGSSSGKSLTTAASKASESLDKKVEKLEKELASTLENFDSAIKNAVVNHGNVDDIIATYKDAMASINSQMDKYRKKGIKENSKYINDLKVKLKEYKDKMASSLKEFYEEYTTTLENIAKLNENMIKRNIQSGNVNNLWEYVEQQTEAIASHQDLIEEQIEKLRENGFGEADKEVADLSLKWWDLQDEKVKAYVDMFDQLIDRFKSFNTLYERMRDNSVKDLNRNNVLDNDRNAAMIANNELMKNLKQQKEQIEKQIIAYTSIGYSSTSKEVLDLKEEWYKLSDAVEDAREKIVNTLNDMASNTRDVIDEMKNVYDVFKEAADSYAETNGFISVDSFKSILELGPQYMQMLKDENGMLVINKEKIDDVIKSMSEKAAVESALSYLEQVKIAYLYGEDEMLDKLIMSTAASTEGTWSLVYANAALLKVLGLSDEQYEQLMWNLKAYQAIANNVKDGVSVVGTKDLEELRNGAEDLLDYVMDMIKHEIDEQIKALEKMKDDYSDIIKLKKESLEITKKESDYQEEIADKLKEASKIQAQINALSLDDSREAAARRKELEENLAEIQKDIAKEQADYALDRQKDMLDDSQDAYEKQKNEEIDTLEKTISSKEKLYRLAIERIETHWDTIYSELINWNTEYGNSLNKEITKTWELAQEAVKTYGTDFEEVIDKISAKIKEMRESLNGVDDELHLIIGETGDVDMSVLNEDAINAIVSMMEQNSASWLVSGDGTHTSNEKLADELRKYGIDPYYNSRTGEWYTDSSMNTRLYDKYGDSFNTANAGSSLATTAIIKRTVDEMKANSAAWASASAEQRTKLSKRNIDLAKSLNSFGIDVGSSTDKNGVWVIKSDRYNPGNRGKRLYDVYHKGGIVGDIGTIKQNEMIAKLEKGEAVLDKKKESGVMRLLDFAASVADKVGGMIDGSTFGTRDLAIAGSFGAIQPVQAYNVTFGDTYITGTSDENISAHKKITRDFTNEVLRQLNIKR